MSLDKISAKVREISSLAEISKIEGPSLLVGSVDSLEAVVRLCEQPDKLYPFYFFLKGEFPGHHSRAFQRLSRISMISG
jgi:hypothetical protein